MRLKRQTNECYCADNNLYKCHHHSNTVPWNIICPVCDEEQVCKPIKWREYYYGSDCIAWKCPTHGYFIDVATCNVYIKEYILNLEYGLFETIFLLGKPTQIAKKDEKEYLKVMDYINRYYLYNPFKEGIPQNG